MKTAILWCVLLSGSLVLAETKTAPLAVNQTAEESLRNASATLASTQIRLEARIREVEDSLRTDPQYKAALKQLAEAQARLQTARTGTAQEQSDAASHYTEARVSADRILKAALDRDPIIQLNRRRSAQADADADAASRELAKLDDPADAGALPLADIDGDSAEGHTGMIRGSVSVLRIIDKLTLLGRCGNDGAYILLKNCSTAGVLANSKMLILQPIRVTAAQHVDGIPEGKKALILEPLDQEPQARAAMSSPQP